MFYQIFLSPLVKGSAIVGYMRVASQVAEQLKAQVFTKLEKRNFLKTLGNRIQANSIVVADIAVTIKSGRRSLARCFFSYPFISLYSTRKILKKVCSINQVVINSSLNQAYATIMVIIFKEFLMFYQISLSPKLNRNVIISNKYGMQQVPPKLQTNSDLRS